MTFDAAASKKNQKNSPPEVVYLPDTDPILSAYANSYKAIQFTVRLLEYLKNPINRSKGKLIISDEQHQTDVRIFYTGNAVNMAQLTALLKTEAEKCIARLKTIQYTYEKHNFKINDVQAGKFTKNVNDSIDLNDLNPFFSQHKVEVLRQTMFKEIEITPEIVIDDPRVKAMLDLIVYAEGTSDNYGKIANGKVEQAQYFPELVGKRDVVITDFSRFPDIYVRWKAGQKLSSAAGRYQINHDIWIDFGRGDFSSHSQDLVAVRIMVKEDMVEPLLSGNIKQAIFAGGTRRWASFPHDETGKSFAAGQPAKPLAELESQYKEFLLKY